MYVKHSPQMEFIMPSEVPQNALTSSKLPYNIEEVEASTPLPIPLIMPPP